MQKPLLFAALCFSLTACTAQYEWKREGAGPEARDADAMTCRKEMSRHGGNDARDVFDDCMKAKGYEKNVTGYGM